MSRALGAGTLSTVLLCLSTQACSETHGPPAALTAEAGGDGAVDNPYAAADSAPGALIIHTYAPTYDAVWREILQPSCAVDVCHAGGGDYLHLWSEAIGYQSLVDASAEGPLCAATALRRVRPYEPDASLLYLKITSPPCGARMPLSYAYNGALDPREVEQIRQWIVCGAPDGDGGCMEAGDSGDAGADASGD